MLKSTNRKATVKTGSWLNNVYIGATELPWKQCF